MGNGDLTTDLSLGIVAPTPSVRPEGRNLHDPGEESKARRRLADEARKEEPELGEENDLLTPDDGPQHQLDDLA
jgi:hypothetical protein